MAMREHLESVAAARGVLQGALASAATDAARQTAQIAFLRAVLASGRTNGVRTGALAALHALGVDDSGQNGDT